jgi:hypothetical protein
MKPTLQNPVSVSGHRIRNLLQERAATQEIHTSSYMTRELKASLEETVMAYVVHKRLNVATSSHSIYLPTRIHTTRLEYGPDLYYRAPFHDRTCAHQGR